MELSKNVSSGFNYILQLVFSPQFNEKENFLGAKIMKFENAATLVFSATANGYTITINDFRLNLTHE